MTPHPGWNPVRRSRKIGTAAQGHGQDNLLTIPESWHEPLLLRRYYERLKDVVPIARRIGERTVTFLVEPARPGSFHPCAPDEIATLLAHAPPEHLALVDLVVLRQPTRKQRSLQPVWGRAVFLFEASGWSGPAVVLEAQTLEPYRWGKGLGPAGWRELERLRADGHEIVSGRRGFEIRPTPASLRNTLLYRTLLHELGHLVDAERWTLEEWNVRPKREKEDFAHRYAAEWVERLRREGVVPLPPDRDRAALERDGLSEEWFRPVSAQGSHPERFQSPS